MLPHVGAVVKLRSLDDKSEDVLMWLHELLDAGRLLMTNGCVVHLCECAHQIDTDIMYMHTQETEYRRCFDCKNLMIVNYDLF